MYEQVHRSFLANEPIQQPPPHTCPYPQEDTSGALIGIKDVFTKCMTVRRMCEQNGICYELWVVLVRSPENQLHITGDKWGVRVDSMNIISSANRWGESRYAIFRTRGWGLKWGMFMFHLACSCTPPLSHINKYGRTQGCPVLPPLTQLKMS